MIPKIIHYCWFGGNPLPEQYKKYMESWKKYCSDYEIVEWNESNFDVTQNQSLTVLASSDFRIRLKPPLVSDLQQHHTTRL